MTDPDDKTPKQPAPPSDPIALIESFIAGLGPLYSLLHGPLLTTRERLSLATHLFPSGPLFVECTAEALQEERDLFPDIPIDGAELAREQALANALNDLRAHLLVLGAMAHDAHLSTQSSAIVEAMSAVKQVRQDYTQISALG